MATAPTKHPVCLSIGIMAWNEEDSIRATLDSLFRQSVFQRLAQRHELCEIVVVANGCADRTAAVTRDYFVEVSRTHPWASGFAAHVVEVAEAGKCPAWNRFVHEFSSLEARFLCLMDADIAFHHRDTIFNLVAALERNPHAAASSGRQCKDILFKPRKTLCDRLSLATTNMSATSSGAICGQLYCVRAAVARNIYLPRGLGSVEDGFIKAVVCTDFLTRASDPSRVVTAPEAAHVFQAYVSLRDILKNQKRQTIGQTTVHVLEKELRALPLERRRKLAETLRQMERDDPDWLKKAVDRHVQSRHGCWRLFPGAATFRLRRLWKLRGLRKLTHLPAALAGSVVTLVACWQAHRALRAGVTHYWPQASRRAIGTMPQLEAK